MSNVQGRFNWSSDAVDLLKKMHAKGQTFSEIANALAIQFRVKVSRSAVIGKAQRIGLCGSLEDARLLQLKRGAARRLELGIIKREAKPKTEKKMVRKSVVLPPLERLPVMNISERQAYLDAIAVAPKTIIHPEFGGCRWPLYRTAPDGQSLSCCNPRESGPYCPSHARFAWQKHRTPEDIKTDGEIWAGNIKRSGVRQGATRHFNAPLEMAR